MRRLQFVLLILVASWAHADLGRYDQSKEDILITTTVDGCVTGRVFWIPTDSLPQQHRDWLASVLSYRFGGNRLLSADNEHSRIVVVDDFLEGSEYLLGPSTTTVQMQQLTSDAEYQAFIGEEISDALRSFIRARATIEAQSGEILKHHSEPSAIFKRSDVKIYLDAGHRLVQSIERLLGVRERAILSDEECE